MQLLKTQKNLIFDLIEKSSLSPSQFQFIEPTILDSSLTLKYKGTSFTFNFVGGVKDTYNCWFSPGYDNYRTRYDRLEWFEVASLISDWIKFITAEINAPDKWSRLEAELKGININYEYEEGKFSASEYEELKVQMNSLKASFATIGLLPEQINTINAKLDHLTELGLSMNKFDWKSLFVGTIINLITALALTSEEITAIRESIAQAFKNIFFLN